MLNLHDQRCGGAQTMREPVNPTKMVERGARVAVVTGVPMEECPACGTRWMSLEVAESLDVILRRMIDSGAEMATTASARTAAGSKPAPATTQERTGIAEGPGDPVGVARELDRDRHQRIGRLPACDPVRRQDRSLRRWCGDTIGCVGPDTSRWRVRRGRPCGPPTSALPGSRKSVIVPISSETGSSRWAAPTGTS